MKLKPLLYSIVLIFAIGCLCACDDILEPSISKSEVILEAPADQYISASYTINFWWDQVNHALSYHLQVVTNSFTSPGGLVLDTIVTSYKFSYSLSPGIYQWRVMAENGSSSTPYTSPRSFTVGASSLAVQTVQLSSPSNNYLTNQGNVIFQWGSIYGVTEYQIEVDTNNFANPNSLVLNETIPGTQLNFTFPKDQTYQWRVKAENDTAQSNWSTVYSVTFDNIPPGQVTLASPANGQTISSPVTLQWNSVATAATYKLYVLKSDSTTLYSSTFPVTTNTTTYIFNQGSSGDVIYWKVSAVDAAGNVGQANALRSFVVQ